jgi:DNA-directed RNA polymerase specialized sigma24 family protein
VRQRESPVASTAAIEADRSDDGNRKHLSPSCVANRRMDVHLPEIYLASAGRLVAQLYGLTGDLGEAEDAVQEAFARALLNLKRLNDIDNPEAWLRTVAMNIARTRHRRRRLFAGLVRSGRLDPGDVPPISADHVALVAALQRVPTRTREALVLHYIADLPVAEVADVLGCSGDAVKTRLARGRKALAEQLDETLVWETNHA